MKMAGDFGEPMFWDQVEVLAVFLKK